MSALDQAFIKAYAKDQPAATAVAPATAPGRAPLRDTQAARPRAAVVAIEQLYRDGSLYRIEQPGGVASARAVPQPHVRLLPPTSPRRGVQRSLLRLLANQPAEIPAVPVDAPPPRVARKVIIRHIAHSAPPAPLGVLRTQAIPLPRVLPEIDELPPETIADEPPNAPPAIAPPPVLIPAGPMAAPPSVPLNEMWQPPMLLAEAPLAIHAPWSLAESAAGIVLLAEPAEFSAAGPDGLVAVQLDSLRLPELPAAPTIDEPAPHKEEEAARFAGKALDHADEPTPAFRRDEPHASSFHRPHVKFAPTKVEPEQAVAVPSPAPIDELPSEELKLAESPAELEIDELAVAGDAAMHAAERVEPVAAEPVKAVPLWEVDRFHWPKTCEKLLAAEGSYFAQAGEKLLAAVRDGLRVLAITGSRRGEGRTTLALCLARVAAQAGVQTAILDADFARPQLASKIGLEITYGWQDAAMGKIPLSEAAVKSLADNVTALPLETSAVGARLSLADPRVTATIRAAAATFELLILDLGPCGPGEAIAFPLGERCPIDAAIVVRDLRFATLAESERIGHDLADAGIEAVGIAENFVVAEELPETSV